MSLSNIAYPNSNQIPLECGDLHLDGTLYNSSGTAISLIPVAVGEVTGSNTITNFVITGVSNFVLIPSGPGGIYTGSANLPLNNQGFTLVTFNVLGELFIARYSGYYNITYSFSTELTAETGTSVLDSYIVTNFNNGPATICIASTCSETITGTAIVYTFTGSCLLNLLAGDKIFGIGLEATGDMTATILNATVYASLVSV